MSNEKTTDFHNDGSTNSKTGDGSEGFDYGPLDALFDQVRLPGLMDHHIPGSGTPESIGDRYRVLRKLGQGGFGRVYLAEDPIADRLVAIKVPNIDLCLGSQLDRYLNEARLVAQVGQHSNIVTLFDVVADDDECYLVSEYIEGQTLAEALKDGPISAERTARIISQVADALAHAHKKLVHRDLKPENILLDQKDVPHLTDFGLSIRDDQLSRRVEQSAGTYRYLAPEQLPNSNAYVDGRTDIWALGVILYKSLTGKFPFDGSSASEILDQIETRDPKPPRMINENIPKELERICLKCLCKHPTERYSNTSDVATELRRRLPPKEDQAKPIMVTSVFAAVALVGSLFFVFWPEAPIQESAQQGIQFGVTLASGGKKGIPIEAAGLPASDRDNIQVTYSTPNELEASLFWLDSAGILHEISTSPLRQRESERNQYVYPDAENGERIAGDGGIEAIFVCAAENGSPKAADVRELTAQLSPPSTSDIAIGTVFFSQHDARWQEGRVRTRGPSGEYVERPREPMLKYAEALRRVLAVKYQIRGVAFPYDPEDR